MIWPVGKRMVSVALRAFPGLIGIAFLSFLPDLTLADEQSSGVSGPDDRPQISSFVRFPFPVKVPQRILDIENKGEPIPYDRQLPIFGRELAERGYVFPKPFGATMFSVYNEQVNIITDISVALGIGGPPPPDKPLVDLPFVTIGETISYTTNTQFKLDTWILPFLNIFVGKGTVNGHADLTVRIDLDDFLPPPVCNPANPCGTVDIPFSPKINGQVVTLGGNFIYAREPWFTGLNLSYTTTTNEDRTDITNTTAGLRAGRFWVVNRGLTITAYGGATYMKSDDIIDGVTQAPGTLPGGQTLDVRYRVRQTNRDRWAAVAGLSFDVKRNVGVQIEGTYGRGTKRAMVSAFVRF
jgi:hypothetical protein